MTVGFAALAAAALPALAQDAADMSTMTCADLMAMGPDEQMQAVQDLQGSMASMGGDAAAGTADVELAETADAGTSGATDTDVATADAARTEAAGAAAAGGAPSGEAAMGVVVTACEGDSSMMVKDAMTTVTNSTGGTGTTEDTANSGG